MTMKTSPERLMRWTLALASLLASTALWWPTSAVALASVRIKEVAAVQGVRNNQLVGYGLVVGLDGTGDQTTQTPFTTQSLNACCSRWVSPCRPAPACSCATSPR
jgi:flagellar P-ring protein precursor FlgI